MYRLVNIVRCQPGFSSPGFTAYKTWLICYFSTNRNPGFYTCKLVFRTRVFPKLKIWVFAIFTTINANFTTCDSVFFEESKNLRAFKKFQMVWLDCAVETAQRSHSGATESTLTNSVSLLCKSKTDARKHSVNGVDTGSSTQSFVI